MKKSAGQTDLDILSALFDHLPIPVWVKDKDHRHILANDTFCNHFSLKKEDLIGSSEMPNLPVTRKKIIWEAEKQLLLTGVPDVKVQPMTFPDGQRRKIVITKSLIRTKNNNSYILAVLDDITEKDSLLKRLKEGEKKYKTIFDLLPEGIGINRLADRMLLEANSAVNLSGKKHVIWTIRDISKLKYAQELIRESEVLYKTLVNKSSNFILIHMGEKIAFANDALIALTGLTKQKIVGRKIWDLLMDPVIVPGNMLIHELFTDPTHLHKEVKIKASIRPGETRDFVLRSNMITYKRKDAILTILTDITETINVEKLLLNKTIETEEIDRKRFAADLHDDLGPILSSIKLHLGLMQKTCSNDKQKENIHICEELLLEAIEKMSIVANNLMPRLIDNHGLEAALKSFCKSISREGMFSAELVSNLGNIRFPMDIEMHLFRIIGELINNTIKHSGGSKASIRLTYSKGLLSLAYMDSGKGYNPEDAMKKPDGRGLSNILHRVNLIEGQIEFSSIKNGTKVHLQKRIKQI